MHVVSREMNQILLSNLDIWFVSIGSPERESVSSCVQSVVQLVNSSRANQCLTWNSTGIWPILDENATGQLLIEFEERMRKHLDSKLCRSVTRLICELFMNDQMDRSRDRYLDTIRVCLSTLSRDSFLPLIRLTRMEKEWIHLFAGFSR